jgi:hypothetical protein
MSEFLFRGQIRKGVGCHVHLHGKWHYTIEPYVKCLATTKKFTAYGPFGVETGLMSTEITSWLDEMSFIDFGRAAEVHNWEGGTGSWKRPNAVRPYAL